MSHKGIPTLYNWRRYRSRLEARWAVMFDMLGWKAEYEPFDCDGWAEAGNRTQWRRA